MIAVITGDIIGSKKAEPRIWLKTLKNKLNNFGVSPSEWEIYRGDEFQLEVAHPEEALLIAFQLKACIKTIKDLDVRMAIGIGEKSFQGDKVSQSNGSAFNHSGTSFNLLKTQKVTLAVQSPSTAFDKEMNLMLKLALVTMDKWSAVSAEIAEIIFANPDLLQEEIGKQLQIKQGAVSQRINRGKIDLMIELDRHYRNRVNNIM
ncbi:MAG TPA: SatD family protein [Cyclobacteriaceae bacterium]|nr:SatD family protein [Cyclobacteriaceae bacterium]